MTRRSIGVFTASRADLGPLGPVIAALDAEPLVDLRVYVSGTHLSPGLGGRPDDVLVEHGRVVRLNVGLYGTAASSLGEVFGRVAAAMSASFAEDPVDLLLVLGDRWELLAVAGAALLHDVPIAHLHGGETTEGAIDERIRHGLTKLADLHLCATRDSARRIRQLGEEPWRIHVTGAPGLDRLRGVVPLPDDRIGRIAGRPLQRPLAVVVYHPGTVDRAALVQRTQAVLESVAATCRTAIVLHPGADPGAEGVSRTIDQFVELHEEVTGVRNLGPEYPALLAAADLLVGNSSSGIIEAASLDLPVVDVGDRQGGRLRPDNVVHVSETDEPGPTLDEAVREALTPAARERARAAANPYGDGKSSPRIVLALLDAPLERLRRKPLVATAAPPHTDVLSALTVHTGATVREALATIDRGRQQLALVVDARDRLVATLSDGDIRRGLLRGGGLDDLALPWGNDVPVVANEGAGSRDVLALMRRTGVSQVPVLDKAGRVTALHVLRSVLEDVIHGDEAAE